MQKKRRFTIRNIMSWMVFVVPAVILVSISTVIPTIMNFFYSFTNWDGISSTPQFVGLKNYINMFKDKAFMSGSVVFTARFTVFFVVLVNIFALAMAFLLVKQLRTANILRGLLYVPQVISLLMVGYTWKFILGDGFENLYDITGWSFFNWSWLGDRKLAFLCVLLLTIWQQAGFFCVIYIAGIQSLPEDIMEAAEIDGASGLGKFFWVTFPLLMPSVTVCLFTSILNAIRVYELPFVLTAGGPSGSTISLTMSIYTDAFKSGLYGYATAKSVFYFAIVTVLTMASLAFTKRREVEA